MLSKSYTPSRPSPMLLWALWLISVRTKWSLAGSLLGFATSLRTFMFSTQPSTDLCALLREVFPFLHPKLWMMASQVLGLWASAIMLGLSTDVLQKKQEHINEREVPSVNGAEKLKIHGEWGSQPSISDHIQNPTENNQRHNVRQEMTLDSLYSGKLLSFPCVQIFPCPTLQYLPYFCNLILTQFKLNLAQWVIVLKYVHVIIIKEVNNKLREGYVRSWT